MKFSLVSLLPVLGLFTTAFADPVAQPPAVVKRQDYSVESSILADLLNNVKSQTGAINATIASLPADADIVTKAAAQAAVNSHVQQITALINAATDQVKQLVPSAKAKRQGVTIPILVDQIAALLFELSGTLNLVIAALGLTGLLAFLNPLTTGLSALFLALALVVDGLLVAIGILLNGILVGLSVALAGLTL